MKKRCCFQILSLFCLLTSISSFAQSSQEQDTVYYRYFYMRDFEQPAFGREIHVDTLLNGFQLYEPVRFGQGLGNTGKAFRSFRPEPSGGRGFAANNNVFSHYMPQLPNIRYYNVSSPFTDLYYVMGGKKEQILKIIHSQNINKDFNVALNYDIINSPGSFRRQFSDATSFRASSHYTGKKKRYRFIANTVFNKCNNQENGGLDNVSEFDNDLLGRPELYDVRLTNAQNKLKDRAAYVKQFLHFNKKAVRDSSGHITKSIFKTSLSHSVHARRETFAYIDNSPSAFYYPLFHFDNYFTGDSSRYNTLDNTLALSHSFVSKNNLRPVLSISAGLTHRYIDYRQFAGLKSDSVIHVLKEKHFFNQYIPFASVSYNPVKKLYAHAEAFAVTGDYNGGDYGGKAEVRYSIAPTHKISLGLNYNLTQPAFIYSSYVSNHFIWHYKHNKVQSFDVGLKHDYEGYRVELLYNRFTNMIYMDAYARPRQYAGDINLFLASVHKNFRVKSFHFDNHIFIQYTGNDKVMPMPLLASHQSLYWGTHVFKQALFAQIGIDLHYNTTYYAYSYMPASRSFFLQNQKEVGNYPLIDVFINMHIQNARIFVKAAHLNERFTGDNMYATPGYPLQGRAFKVGVSWMFRD